MTSIDGEPADSAHATAGRRRSAAGLLALLLFLWAQSLLLFDWARREVFAADGQGHLVLLLPIFGGAVVAAGVALIAKRLGFGPVGGSLAHRFGIASGLLAVVGLLLLGLGPGVRRANEAALERVAVLQVERIATALELHLEQHGTYPIGMGVDSLAAALSPDFLDEGTLLDDPWENRLRYQSMNGGRGYLLVSTGRDGVPDVPLGAYAEMTEGGSTVNDVVMRTGQLMRPAGRRP